MDYRKLDAALAAELEGAPPGSELAVFIHTVGPMHDTQASELKAMGAKIQQSSGNVVTASVSPQIVDTLSERPWVSRIALSRKLRPLGGI